MTLELRQNIWKSDESGLGFYCVNIFECSEKNPELKELLKNRILKEKEFGPIRTMKKVLKEPTNYYGSILLNKIETSDFKTLNFSDLNSEFQEYWKDEDWGEDLPIFKKNFELAISSLNRFELSIRNFYYINAEKTDSEKLTDPNFFTYLVCVISTEKESNKIITLTFGLD
tara:strand:- start:119 stop:631 length:513 start_codon:yes stop_codon:yes gene_type:complete